MDLVFNKKFIWLFFFGFGSIFIIYIFIIFIIFYLIYLIYYFKTREQDRVRIIVNENTQVNGVNTTAEEYSILNNENLFLGMEIKKDLEKEKRKNKFVLVLGIIITLIGSFLYIINSYRKDIVLICLFIVVAGLITLIKGVYGLYVK